METILNEKVEAFKELIKKIKAYNEAINVMYWDLRTGAPEKAVDGRSEVIGMLSSEVFQLSTSNELGELLEYLSQPEQDKNLDEITRAAVKVTKKDFDQNKKIPADLYKEYVVLTSKAESVWAEAKDKSDFSLFQPYLEKIVHFNQQFAELWGYEGSKYNALLDNYEQGMTVEKLDPIFTALREDLVPLIQKVAEAKQVETSFLRKKYPKHQQEQFSKYILEEMGYDFKAGRIDETVHPFQITLNHGDVRVLTKYEENDLTVSLFSTLHEGGHAQYEQNIASELDGTPIYEGASMGIHESQSRFWENVVGRNELFWNNYYSKLTEMFPEQLKDVAVKDFYKGVNEIKPSLIRIDADELTYNLHIMLRYELEKALINGEISVDQLPALWNEKMKDYLGVEPANDGEGVLQDVHWSAGLIGYFPTYALGNIYAAQFTEQMKKELSNFDQLMLEGNLIPIKEWLDEKIHQYGKLKTPTQLLKDITGEELNAKYLIQYLTNKVNDIYNV